MFVSWGFVVLILIAVQQMRLVVVDGRRSQANSLFFLALFLKGCLRVGLQPAEHGSSSPPSFQILIHSRVIVRSTSRLTSLGALLELYS